MKTAYDIIKRPVLTEKAYEGIEDKRYVFEVDIRANKAEIKAAVEEAFKDDGVKVAKVNTVRTIGKMKRQGRTQAPGPHPGHDPRDEEGLCDPEEGLQAHQVLRRHGHLKEREETTKWLSEFTSRLRPPGGLCRC